MIKRYCFTCGFLGRFKIFYKVVSKHLLRVDKKEF